MFTSAPTLSYTGSDATAEILIMLIGAALIGYLARILVERFRTMERPVIAMPAAKPAAATVRREVAPAAMPVASAAPVQHAKPDDLKIIEGIGPKVEAALHAAGMTTFAEMAAATPSALRTILDKHGERFALVATDTWPRQAALVRDGLMDEFDAYKRRLYGGIE